MYEVPDWVMLPFTTVFIFLLMTVILDHRKIEKIRHMYNISLDKLVAAEDKIDDLTGDLRQYQMVYDDAKMKIKEMELNSEDLKNFRDLTYCLTQFDSTGRSIRGSFTTYHPSDNLKELFTDRTQQQQAAVIDERTFADIALTQAGFMWDIWEGKTKWIPCNQRIQLDTSDFVLLPHWKQEWERSNWRTQRNE